MIFKCVSVCTLHRYWYLVHFSSQKVLLHLLQSPRFGVEQSRWVLIKNCGILWSCLVDRTGTRPITATEVKWYVMKCTHHCSVLRGAVGIRNNDRSNRLHSKIRDNRSWSARCKRHNAWPRVRSPGVPCRCRCLWDSRRHRHLVVCKFKSNRISPNNPNPLNCTSQ